MAIVDTKSSASRDDSNAQNELDALLAETEKLREENESLKARVAELMRASDKPSDKPKDAPIVSTGQTPRDAVGTEKMAHLLRAILDHTPSVIFVKDPDGRYLLVNRKAMTLYARSYEELIGGQDADFFPPEAVAAMRAKDEEALQAGSAIQFEESVPYEGEIRYYITIKFPIFAEDRSLIGVCGIATDVTAQKRQELERNALREQIIAAQEAALRELSTPLIPIAKGVVAMPLVGGIDNDRADRIMSTLLDGIVLNQAHSVILDITGVRMVDSHVAAALVAAAKSVKLLGAQVVLTGIRPEVARTLIELGMNLEGIVTRANFQAGIAFALKQS